MRRAFFEIDVFMLASKITMHHHHHHHSRRRRRRRRRFIIRDGNKFARLRYYIGTIPRIVGNVGVSRILY